MAYERIIKRIWIVLLIIGTILPGSCKTIKNKSVKGKDKTATIVADTVFKMTVIDTLNQTNTDGHVMQTPVIKSLETKDYYEKAYDEIHGMLEGWKPLNFKRAVFVSENAFFNDSLNYTDFINRINLLERVTEGICNITNLKDYTFPDSLKLKKNYAIFQLLKDTVQLGDNVQSEPMRYDFEDNLGIKKWSNTFVTRLLYTGYGNCRSMPYLYKILANEIHAEAYLSLAPNHIYLKHRSKHLGWYNTELTSGEFPSDAWVKASGYITIEAIRSGIYMDTLSQIQTVALCSYDLAKGYLEKTKNYNDGFVIKCCDLTLKYHPTNINAIILKAETLKRIYQDLIIEKDKQQEAMKVFEEMQKLYVSGVQMGYREMPKEMYQAWLNSLQEGKIKFSNNEINSTFKKNNQ